MREDIDKVIHEHEKNGKRSGTFKQYRRLKKFTPLDDDVGGAGHREGMRFRYGWNGRHSITNLNAIEGAIRKAIGTPFDKFYSEYAKLMAPHTRQQADWIFDSRILCKSVIIGDDGELYVTSTYVPPELLSTSRYELYVDPRDGIIKRNKHFKTFNARRKERKEREAAEEAKVYRKIDENNCLRFIEGVWYHFTMKDTPKAEFDYVRPAGTYTTINSRVAIVHKVYQIGYAMLGKGIITKTWEELNGQERKRFGTPVAKYGTVKDIFTGETYPTMRSSPSKYHASKKTASQKMLRKAGLLK